MWNSPEDISFDIQIPAIIKLEERSLACKQLFATTNKILQTNKNIYLNGFSFRNTTSNVNNHVDTHGTILNEM